MSLVNFTVTRNTQKNVVNSEGFLENVGNNVPGFEYKRELVPLFSNYLASSDLLNGNYYVKSFEETVIEGGQSFPVSGVDGYKITAPAAAPVNISASYTNIFKSEVEENSKVCFSFYAKAGTAKQVVVGMNDYPNFNNYLLQLNFDLPNPLVSQPFGSINAGSEALSNGWYRFYVSFDIGSVGQFTDIAIIISSAFGGGSNTLSNGRDMYFAGLQLNTGISPLTYENPEFVSDEIEEVFVYRGTSIEPPSTNYAKASEDLVNTTYWNSFSGLDIAAVSEINPKNEIGSFLLSEDTIDDPHYFSFFDRPLSFNSGETWTQSWFVKKGDGANAPDIVQLVMDLTAFGVTYANFDISVGGDTSGTITASSGGTAGIRYYGNGWYRIWLTGTTITTNGNVDIIIALTNNNPTAGRFAFYQGQSDTNIFIQFPQLEKNDKPTSYIETGISIATRNADIISLSNANAYIPDEGQVVFEWEQQETDTLNIGVLSTTVEAGVRRLKFIYTSTEQKLYIDGVLVDSATGTYDWSNMDVIDLGNFEGFDQPLTYLKIFAINEHTI